MKDSADACSKKVNKLVLQVTHKNGKIKKIFPLRITCNYNMAC